MLSEEQLSRFQTLWFQRFGKDISAEGAHESAIQLLSLVSAIIPASDKAGGEEPQSAAVNGRNGSVMESAFPVHWGLNTPISTEKAG